MVTWSFCTYSVSLYGPVPIGLVESAAGSLPAGAKPLTTMAANLPGSTGSGFFSVIFKLVLLVASTLSIAAYQLANGLAVFGSISRSTFHLASSAVNAC